MFGSVIEDENPSEGQAYREDTQMTLRTNNVIAIGNTVLFLSNSEVDDLYAELAETIHSSELMGLPTVDIQDIFSLTIAEARSLLKELKREEAVNWGRDGF